MREREVARNGVGRVGLIVAARAAGDRRVGAGARTATNVPATWPVFESRLSLPPKPGASPPVLSVRKKLLLPTPPGRWDTQAGYRRCRVIFVAWLRFSLMPLSMMA